MTSAKSVRYNWIDWSKSIAIFLVIWGHVPMQSETHTIIYSFHMPLFFLISGYLYNPKGTIKEELYKDKAVNALGATEDIVKEYLTLVTIQSKMRAAIIADADTNVSDADANTSAYSYVNVSKTSYKDADGNTQEYTDDEKAELADTVQKFHDAAADTTLDTAADEYGYTVSTGTFSSDNTTLDEEVLNALEGLKSEGELSDVVETDNYYYVLRLDEITDADATEEHRQEIISQRQSDLYNEVLQGWKDEAEWVLKDKVWDKVTFDNLFTTTVESTETTETTESSTTDNAVTENTEAVEGTESVQ